ncbi:MAG: hypothetical protein IT423_18905 [Pirellulaceae bacterium]|nr:hypothetical protein [Pirellulaceae bacterium]
MTTHPPVGIQPRFALLHHAMEAAAGRFDHWDLMLEHSGTLLTLELDRIPSGEGMFQTRRLADHRLAYLDYEGHVSGNRGQVYRLDRGRYRELQDHNAQHERRFQYELTGSRLKALIAADQPLIFLPFAKLVELQALQWDWHD